MGIRRRLYTIPRGNSTLPASHATRRRHCTANRSVFARSRHSHIRTRRRQSAISILGRSSRRSRPLKAPACRGFKLKVLVADNSKMIHDIFNDIAARSPDPLRGDLRRGRPAMLWTRCNRGGIHLAFIDVNMPEMSGMEAVGKARTGGNKTFVTLMSANANQRRMQLALQLKIYEFLAKPFTHRTGDADPEDLLPGHAAEHRAGGRQFGDRAAHHQEGVRQQHLQYRRHRGRRRADRARLLRQRRVRRGVSRLQHAGPSRHRNARTACSSATPA